MSFGQTRAVDGVSFAVPGGRCVALLGESGAGKSTLCRAVLGLLDDAASAGGGLRYGGLDLLALDEAAWRRVRWAQIALAFQSSGALDPLRTIAEQIAEPMRWHDVGGRRDRAERVRALLDEVGLDASLAHRRPRELSGGQRRAASVAIALACDPTLLVLDEPTAGLDPLARATLLATLRRVRAERPLSVLLVTHDVGFAESLADDVAFLYRGWVAEQGPAAPVLRAPRSPYAFGLLNAVPSLRTVKELRGLMPPPCTDPDDASPTATVAARCPFVDRCPQAIDRCHTERPEPLPPPDGADGRLVACLRGGLVRVLEATALTKTYHTVRSGDARPALDGVDVHVHAGEVLGIAGLNGAGKSTLVGLLADLLEPDRGEVAVEGVARRSMDAAARRRARRAVQLVQQDPFTAVSGRLTIGAIVAEPLQVQDRAERPSAEGARRLVRAALAAMRLPAGDAFLARYPSQVSGGELQRVAVARALVAEPKVLLLDEPVSMLDPSEAAELLQLVKAEQVRRGTAVVLVSHDLAVLLRIADRIAVLDGGRIVEQGPGEELFANPRTEVVRALVDAARTAT